MLSNRRVSQAKGSAAWDTTVRVMFCGAGRQPRESLECVWHELQEAGRIPARFRPDGKVVAMLSRGESHLDVGLELRRVVPFAAALQGRVTLHASAVASDNSVIAFIGESSAGKSTWAASLHKLGFAIICDDLLPVRLRRGLTVVPYANAKRFLPLRQIYFLSRGAVRFEVTSLPAKEVLSLLCVHGFGELRAPMLWQSQFEFYSRIATKIVAARLDVPEDPKALPRMVKAFADDFLGSPSPRRRAAGAGQGLL